MRTVRLVFLGFLAACGSKGGTTVTTPAALGGPSTVAAAFLRAVSDSNLVQMGALWGTSKGPAASTGVPSDWQRRVAVMQLYLRGGEAKVLSEDTFGGDRREVVVQLERPGCVKQVPFSMIRTKDGGWLVNSIDLNAAGNPANPCETPKQKP